MPAENDWILHGPYSDKTLMRNALIYEMGDKINRYTTRRRYCELYINGDYRGYMFMENIKRDVNRVDIKDALPDRHCRQRSDRRIHHESGSDSRRL